MPLSIPLTCLMSSNPGHAQAQSLCVELLGRIQSTNALLTLVLGWGQALHFGGNRRASKTLNPKPQTPKP